MNMHSYSVCAPVTEADLLTDWNVSTGVENLHPRRFTVVVSGIGVAGVVDAADAQRDVTGAVVARRIAGETIEGKFLPQSPSFWAQISNGRMGFRVREHGLDNYARHGRNERFGENS